MKKSIFITSILSLFLVGCSGTKPKLGIDNFELLPCPSSPNCVSTQAKDAEHFIDPILTQSSPLKIKKDLLKILSEFKQAKVVETKEHYIRAEFSSKVFGFVDDVEFYFPDTTIHMRSASRLGHSDFGANRKRIEQIRSKLNDK